MILRVDHLNVHYGSAKVLHDVQLAVREGELVCIVGRNGAGKTTLLKTIGGFLRPSTGSVLFRGERIEGRRPEQVALQGIKYVFQDKRVFGELTVRENIQVAAHPVKEDLSMAIQKVVAIHPKMERLLNSKAKGLSGGERQILLIGRALVGQPQLLLIDEPTEGLAAVIIEEIIRILLSMKKKISMIVVEQNLATVAQLADRVYILKEGAVSREISDIQVIGDPCQYEADL
jgi:ABC-type branched-subunit amino acid transport system ATPase component